MLQRMPAASHEGIDDLELIPRTIVKARPGLRIAAIATLFVTGKSKGSASDFDYATVAYDAATGAQLWVKRYDGPENHPDLIAARPRMDALVRQSRQIVREAIAASNNLPTT